MTMPVTTCRGSVAGAGVRERTAAPVCTVTGALRTASPSRPGFTLDGPGRAVLSICEWGTNQPERWAGNVGHLWRTTGDIYDAWEGKKDWPIGMVNILDLQVELWRNSGPNRWNDPDMWSKKVSKNARGSYGGVVAPHGVTMVRITPML